METVTEKQTIAIKNIESVLGIKFEGESKREAWLWMQEYMPKAIQVETQKVLSEKLRAPTTPQFPAYLDNLLSEEKIDEFEYKYDFDGDLDKEISATKKHLGFY